jgi:DNA-binding transcriptional regulator YiaG
MAMSAKDFRSAIKRLKLSQGAFSRRVKVHRRTVRRWASGESVVPETVSLLLECWVKSGRPITS